MITPSRSAWFAMALFAVAAWFVSGSAGNGSPAGAEPTLRTPRLETLRVALHDNHDDHEEHGRHHEEEHQEHEVEEDVDIDEVIERLDLERAEIEIQQADLQATFGGLELIQEITEIARDPESTASLAVMAASDSMEESGLIPFLSEVIDKTRSETVRRVARLKLAEAYNHTDQPDKAIEQIRALALGE